MHDFTFSWATFFSFVSSLKFFFNTTISSLHCFREIDSASTWKTAVRGRRIVFRKDRSPFHWWDAARTNTGVGPSNLAEIVFEQDQKTPITEKKNQFTLAFSASAFWGRASDWESSSPVSKNNCFTIFRSKQRVRQLGQFFPFWNTTANSSAAASEQRIKKPNIMWVLPMFECSPSATSWCNHCGMCGHTEEQRCCWRRSWSYKWCIVPSLQTFPRHMKKRQQEIWTNRRG